MARAIARMRDGLVERGTGALDGVLFLGHSDTDPVTVMASARSYRNQSPSAGARERRRRPGGMNSPSRFDGTNSPRPPSGRWASG
jgi:hypothetical protein